MLFVVSVIGFMGIPFIIGVRVTSAPSSGSVGELRIIDALNAIQKSSPAVISSRKESIETLILYLGNKVKLKLNPVPSKFVLLIAISN